MSGKCPAVQVARLFDKNDYNSIYTRYFEDLVRSNSIVADPSGWARPETEVRIDLSIPMASALLSHYLVDNRTLIVRQKELLIALLNEWDTEHYQLDEVTITPSISTASLAIFLLLRAKGVKSVFFETPAYFATLEQARSVDLRCVRVPSYHDHSYRCDLTALRQRGRGPIAVWLTQPQFALGQNQSHEQIASIRTLLKCHDFLIIEETADQKWPTELSYLSVRARNLNIIKIRGYMKPLGLNALRIAFIIHAARWRPSLQELQWTVGAGLDYYSLAAAVQIAAKPRVFRSMLLAARERILSLHRRLALLSAGSLLGLSRMENGYLGSAFLEWAELPGTYATKRRTLLKACRSLRMPVTLSSAMIFARDPVRERIRLNYFMSERELEYCVINLANFMRRTT